MFRWPRWFCHLLGHGDRKSITYGYGAWRCLRCGWVVY